MSDLSKYSLLVDDYNTLITVSGTIRYIDDDNNCVVCTEDDIRLSMIFHPKIIEAYDKQDFFLSIGDDVDILGAYINIDNEQKILIIRCMAYPKSPGLLS